MKQIHKTLLAKGKCGGLDHFEVGNLLEVLEIVRDHTEAKVKRGGSDQDVCHCQDFTSGGLLSLDLSGEFRDLKVDVVDRPCRTDLVHIKTTLRSLRESPRTIDSMTEFHHANGREN